MTGEQAIEWIHGKYGLGNKEGLTNTTALIALLGNPERTYPCVHVAGTNGKGSTCSMISSILMACGYRTGLYTSPYLERFNERMRVNGVPIPDEELGAVVTDVRRNVDALTAQGLRPTVFEIGTACAFEYFKRAKVDVAVIEVGLGGRLDPTNVITPALSVITHIGLDHMSILGDTLEEIAAEKAGIVKAGVPCVLYPQEEPARGVILRACEAAEAPLIDAGGVEVRQSESTASGNTVDVRFQGAELNGLRIALPGAHQIDNARTAIAAALTLKDLGFALEDEDIRAGLANARWPGRLEWFGNVLLDGAHNEQGAQMLAAYIHEHVGTKKVVAVCGILRGKAADRIVATLAPSLERAFCVKVEGHRAGDPAELADCFGAFGVRASACESVEDALRCAREEAGEEGVVLVCGSLYLVGTVRTMLVEQG